MKSSFAPQVIVYRDERVVKVKVCGCTHWQGIGKLKNGRAKPLKKKLDSKTKAKEYWRQVQERYKLLRQVEVHDGQES